MEPVNLKPGWLIRQIDEVIRQYENLPDHMKKPHDRKFEYRGARGTLFTSSSWTLDKGVFVTMSATPNLSAYSSDLVAMIAYHKDQIQPWLEKGEFKGYENVRWFFNDQQAQRRRVARVDED